MLISIKTRDEDGSRYMMCAGTVTREVKIHRQGDTESGIWHEVRQRRVHERVRRGGR